MKLPEDAWDCHCHVFGPAQRFPYAPDRSYTPADAPYEALAALHARLGFRHAVIVQGACHGTEHAALLDALARGEGRHRGVALLPADVSDAVLAQLHAAGVRGARFNFVGHLGAAPDPGVLRALCDRIAPLGWHAALHLRTEDLPRLLPLLETLPLPFVVDHMARLDVAKGLHDEGFRQLLALGANPRAWIKISAFDRACGGHAPFDAAIPFAQALLEAYPQRVLWGTDWPHPNIAGPAPDESELLRLLHLACADEETWRAVLVNNPRRLYQQLEA